MIQETTGDLVGLGAIVAVVMGLIEALKLALQKMSNRNGNPGGRCKYEPTFAAIANERLETIIRELESLEKAVQEEGSKTRGAFRAELGRSGGK